MPGREFRLDDGLDSSYHLDRDSQRPYRKGKSHERIPRACRHPRHGNPRAYQQRLQHVHAKIEVISTLVDNIDLLRDMHKELDADFVILEQSPGTLRNMRDSLDAEQGLIEEFLSES